MQIDYNKVLPWHSIEQGFLVGGNGDITVGFELQLPEVYTLSENDYWNLNKKLAEVFARLPSGTGVHKQDMFYMDNYKANFSEADNFTYRSNLRYYDQRPITRHKCRVYVTFSQRNVKETNSTRNSFLGLADFMTKKPFKDADKNFELAISFRDSLHNSIQSVPGLKAHHMGDEDLEKAIFEYMDFSYGKDHKELPSLQPTEIGEGYFKYGNRYISVVSLIGEANFAWVSKQSDAVDAKIFNNGNHLSSTIPLPSSLSFPIALGMPVNHVVNTHFEVMDKELVFDILKAEARNLNVFAMIGNEDAKAKRKNILFNYNEQGASFLEIVTENNYKIVRFSQNVVLSHPDKSELARQTDLAQLSYTNMDGCKTWLENKEAANLYFASLPGNAKANYRTMLMPMENALCYSPWESHYRSDQNGFLLIDRMGNPVVLNLWKSAYLVARNGIVIGPTGSGKSFYINLHVDMSLYTGCQYVIMDKGGSYKKLCLLWGGKYYDSQDRNSMSFNIFLVPQDEKGHYQLLEKDMVDSEGKTDNEGKFDKFNFIVSVILMLWKKGGKIEPVVNSLIKETVIEFYEYVNKNKKFPDFNLYYKFMQECDKKKKFEKYEKYFDSVAFFLILKEYTGNGQYGQLLNSKENIDLTREKLVIFDLQGIEGDKDVFNLLSLVIAELFMDKIRKQPAVKKVLLVDEALDFLMSDVGDFIAGLYRKARKHEGQVLLATQAASFLEGLPSLVQESITNNLDIKILLDHGNVKDKAFPQLKSILSVTDSALNLLDSLEKTESYREVLIITGTLARVFRINVSPSTAMAYSSWSTDNEVIYKKFEKSNSMQTAIADYMEELMLEQSNK